MSVQSVSLYFREGSSDKEYHASIEPADLLDKVDR